MAHSLVLLAVDLLTRGKETLPKKEEESEDHLWNLVLSTYSGEFYHAGQYDEAAIISKIKEEFEIKRKPL